MNPFAIVTGKADVREHDRQQHQVGKNNGCHTEAGSDGHLLDNLDVNQHDGDKTDGIRDERDTTGNQQFAETFPGCGQLISAFKDGRSVGRDHLHTMADGDGKDQERYQDSHRVDTVAKVGQ